MRATGPPGSWPGEPIPPRERASIPPDDGVEPVAGRRVEVGAAARASYAVYGDPGGEQVLFQHPTPGSRLFGRLLDAPARAAGVALVAVDRPGYGRADAYPQSDIDGRADRTVEVVDALGHESFGVLGFGDGAAFALSVADRYPDRVVGAAAVGATTPPDLDGESPSPIPDTGDPGSASRDSEDADPTLKPRNPNGTGRMLATVLREILSPSEPPVESPRAERVAATDPETALGWYDDPDRVQGVDTAVDPAETVRAALSEAFEPGTDTVDRERSILRRWEPPEDLAPPAALLYGETDDHVPPSAGRAFADRIDCGFGRVVGAGHLSALVAGGETACRVAAHGTEGVLG